jgi:hypothetical protein
LLRSKNALARRKHFGESNEWKVAGRLYKENCTYCCWPC